MDIGSGVTFTTQLEESRCNFAMDEGNMIHFAFSDVINK